MSLVKLENVSLVRQGKKVLDNVSLEITRNERIAILGPNGAGKTTLISTMLGLLKPTSGTVHKITDSLSVHKIGVHLQEQHYNPLMTVQELLDLFLFEGDYQELIRKYDIEKLLKRKIFALSGGERQKVYLTLVLENNPDFFVLDEFTTNLDIQTKDQIVEYLQESFTPDKTIILITHYLREAELLCDRLIFVRDGKIVADDRAEHLYRQYQIKSHLVVNLQAHATKIVEQYHQYRQGETLTIPFSDESEKMAIIEQVNAHMHEVAGFKIVEANLEELYRRIYE